MVARARAVFVAAGESNTTIAQRLGWRLHHRGQAVSALRRATLGRAER